MNNEQTDALKELSEPEVDAVADAVIDAMPDGVAGFCKTWGYRQFARHLFRTLHGYTPAKAVVLPLSEERIEEGRHETFSTGNPFCPCDSKTFRKTVRWAEAEIRRAIESEQTKGAAHGD